MADNFKWRPILVERFLDSEWRPNPRQRDPLRLGLIADVVGAGLRTVVDRLSPAPRQNPDDILFGETDVDPYYNPGDRPLVNGEVLLINFLSLTSYLRAWFAGFCLDTDTGELLVNGFPREAPVARGESLFRITEPAAVAHRTVAYNPSNLLTWPYVRFENENTILPRAFAFFTVAQDLLAFPGNRIEIEAGGFTANATDDSFIGVRFRPVPDTNPLEHWQDISTGRTPIGFIRMRGPCGWRLRLSVQRSNDNTDEADTTFTIAARWDSDGILPWGSYGEAFRMEGAGVRVPAARAFPFRIEFVGLVAGSDDTANDLWLANADLRRFAGSPSLQ